MKYYINTYSNAEGFIVEEDGSYIDWVFPISYAKKQYNWKVLARKEWWDLNVKEVTKEEFYSFVDNSIIINYWK